MRMPVFPSSLSARALAGLVLGLVTATLAARPADSPPVPELPPPAPDVFRLPGFVGWPAGTAPEAPPGFRVERYAEGFTSPRRLLVLPDGGILVAESRTESLGDMPPAVRRQLEERGILGPSPDRVVLLREAGGKRVRQVILAGLRQPYGLLLHEGWLYVAGTDALRRVRWQPGSSKGEQVPETLIALPAEAPNNHWTRNLALAPDGRHLLVTVGAATNVNESGNEAPGRAAIWAVDPRTGAKRLFATGLRNPVGLDTDPATGDLWVTVNERDGLGPDVPPDYLARVVEGAFYGWPWVYFGTHPDPRHLRRHPEQVAEAARTARVPELALGAHTVPLGLRFLRGDAFPARYRQGAFVARRGGVGRATPGGYDVVFVAFRDGRPTGTVEPFLTGFVADPEAFTIRGRPADLAELPDGSLLVADDQTGILWRVVPPDEAQTPLATLRLKDQYGREDSVAAYRGKKVVVLVAEVRRLPTVEAWAKHIAQRFPDTPMLTVADVPADRPVEEARLAATLRKRVPAGVAVLMDLERRYAGELRLDTREPALVVFDADGRVAGTLSGRYTPALAERLDELMTPAPSAEP